MKTGSYNVLYSCVSNLAIGLCFVPLLFLCWKKMRKDRAYWMVGIYWLANGLINLSSFGADPGHPPTSNAFQGRLNFFYDLLDTPILLLLFFYAAPYKKRKNYILLSMGLFIMLELGLLGWKGYTFSTSTTIIGAGLLLVLAYSITGLMNYMKRMEHSAFENSMVFVYAALLFAYGSFTIIYIFLHLHPGDLIDKRDTLMLYYISLLLAAMITSMGLWGYGLRRPQFARHS